MKKMPHVLPASLKSGLLAASLLMFCDFPTQVDHETGSEVVKPAFSEKLPNAAGKSITGVVVTYAPGGKSVKHHHAGSVLAYVLSGTIRSQNSATGPVKDYKAGESFFDRPAAIIS